MRILFVDHVRNATITSTYSTASFPVRNLKSLFLDTIYMASTGSDVVTVDLGQNKQIDSLFFAGCNCEEVGVVIKNSSGVTVYTATVSISREVETHYFTEVTGRTIILTLDTPSPTTMVTMKGFGAGVTARYIHLNDIAPQIVNDSSFTRTATGQVLRNEFPSFRGFTITIPNLDRAEFNALMSLIRTLGTHKPTYWDFTEENKDMDDPIYAEINQAWTPVQKANYFNVEIPILECR